jgi:YD repeat-containing protein
VTDASGAAGDWTLLYDLNGRLSHRDGPDGTLDFTYDPLDQMATVTATPPANPPGAAPRLSSAWTDQGAAFFGVPAQTIARTSPGRQWLCLTAGSGVTSIGSAPKVRDARGDAADWISDFLTPVAAAPIDI